MDIDWIKEQLQRPGKSKSGLARFLGIPNSAVTSMLKGTREIKLREVPKINKYFSEPSDGPKVSVKPENEIDNPIGTSIVKVDGHVGAGALIYPNFAEVPPDGLHQIELAWSLRHPMVAYEIVGDSMLPQYPPGQVVICYREGRDPETMINDEPVVVRLKDGRRYLKQLLRGSTPGRYNLTSFNSARLIENVEIEWVGEIHVIVPSRQFRRVNEVR
jgi:repressor LexA